MPLPVQIYDGDVTLTGPENALYLCVMRNDIDAARQHMDKILIDDAYRPQWHHLKHAVMEGHADMTRLLVVFGATPTRHEWTEFQAQDPDKFPEWNKLLRRCGFVIPRVDQSLTDESMTMLDGHFNKTLPQDWLNVLKALHDQGATEAVIAGGALRDTFNKKAVKDVDIFMFSHNNNGAMIDDAFTAAGQKIQSIKGQSISAEAAFSVAAQNWVITTEAPHATEYNIICIDRDAYQKKQKVNTPLPEYLRSSFDIGICQITCDGQSIGVSKNYINDVKNKRLEIYGAATDNHLHRIIQKYPEWTQGEAIKRQLVKPPTKRNYYGTFRDSTSFY